MTLRTSFYRWRKLRRIRAARFASTRSKVAEARVAYDRAFWVMR